MTPLDQTVAIKVLPADDAAPAGKLADVELHFTAGALEGLKRLGSRYGKAVVARARA